MENKAKYKNSYMGITALIFFIIFVVLWFIPGLFISKYSSYLIYSSESVSGLEIDAPVEYHGVTVGKVQSIDLKNSQLVEILLSLKKDAPITRGTVATLTARGLTVRGFTGFVYVSLKDNGTDSQHVTLEPGQLYPVIPTTPSISLSLDSTLAQMNENLKNITDLFQSILDDDTVRSLKGLLHNMNAVSDTLAKNNKRLNSLLINAEKASRDFGPFLETAKNTMGILEKQTLPAAYPALKKLDELSRTLLNVANELKQDPSVLIRGTTPPTPGPGEENEAQ